MLELVRLAGDLQAKAEASAMWQARAELLAHQLGAAEERVRMLEAPTESEPAPVPEPPTPTPDGQGQELRSALERNSAPWWRRWWGRLAE
jgi:hypothetical protein